MMKNKPKIGKNVSRPNLKWKLFTKSKQRRWLSTKSQWPRTFCPRVTDFTKDFYRRRPKNLRKIGEWEQESSTLASLVSKGTVSIRIWQLNAKLGTSTSVTLSTVPSLLRRLLLLLSRDQVLLGNSLGCLIWVLINQGCFLKLMSMQVHTKNKFLLVKRGYSREKCKRMLGKLTTNNIHHKLSWTGISVTTIKTWSMAPVSETQLWNSLPTDKDKPKTQSQSPRPMACGLTANLASFNSKKRLINNKQSQKTLQWMLRDKKNSLKTKER